MEKMKRGEYKNPMVVYCAVDRNGNIQTMRGSSTERTYYKTMGFLQIYVNRHNRINKEQLRIKKFRLVEEKKNGDE
jgi:hypothetical protein